jgi:hypothetical protein
MQISIYGIHGEGSRVGRALTLYFTKIPAEPGTLQIDDGPVETLNAVVLEVEVPDGSEIKDERLLWNFGAGKTSLTANQVLYKAEHGEDGFAVVQGMRTLEA